MKNRSSLFVVLLISSALFSQPSITSFSPNSGAVGSSVIISGTNFSTIPANNIVFFGAIQANVISATTNSLSVTIPAGATYQPITVTVNNLTAYSTNPFIVTFSGAAPQFTSQSFEYAAHIDSVDSDIETTKYTYGDIDGDKKIDVITADRLNNTMSVYRNTTTSGIISFAPKIDFNTGQSPRAVSVGDIDGDGKLDIVVSNINDNTVSVFKNTTSGGSISFAPKVNFVTATQPSVISITDLDKDGKSDIVVNTINLEGYVSVLRNTSSGGTISFAPKIDLQSLGGSIEEIRTADIDGDSKPDIILPNYSHSALTIFRNTSSIGTISFASKIDIGTFTNPDNIEIGDLNDDGKPDIAVGHYIDTRVLILRNVSTMGTITFQSNDSYTEGITPSGMAINDLDGDSKPDLVVTNGLESFSLYKNTSSSGNTISFNSGIKIPALYNSKVMSADFDGDGKTDLAFETGILRVTIWKNRTTSPQIISFTPTSGGDGTTITITGQNFSGVTAVSFGGVAALSFNVVNPTTITAVVGSGSSGVLSITTSSGTAKAGGFIFTGPPVIISFNPTSAAPDSFVTITGLNFNGANSVSFGGVPASSFTVVSSTIIKAVVGTGSSGDVSVTTQNGTGSLAGFSYIARPKIISFNPSSASSGTVIVITGINFSGTTSVTFGGVAALSFNIVSPTTINAIVANGASGIVSVTNGFGTGSLPGFIYIPPPVIASFNPTFAASGAAVTITGANFSGTTSVKFGGTPAGSFTVVNSTTITAIISGGSSGDVAVTTPGGTGALSGFVFIPPPVISSFIPFTSGVGATVTISGTNFSGATAVSFGGVSASSFAVVNATTITAVVSNGASGNVSVTTPGGTALQSGFIFVSPPAITSFTPVATGNGLTVTITGLNLSSATAVSFGGAIASSFTVVSATSIKAIVGNGASGNVSVTTLGGTASLPGFTYIPTPTITSFTPTTTGRGTTVTIIGTNLNGATSVSFGGTSATSFTVVSPNTITAVVGGGSTGLVSVTTAGGTGVLTGFSFTSPPPPVITSFLPSSGEIGTSVTITGDNFNASLTDNIVFFGSTRATIVSATKTQLEVIVPPGASYHPISVLNMTNNLSGYSAYPFLVTFPGGGPFIRNSFAAKQELWNYTQRPFDVVAFDIDGDGKSDLAYTDGLGNSGNNTVSALRNISTDKISFAPKIEFVIGTYPRCLNYGDIDGDGKQDLVIANLGTVVGGTVVGTGTVSILRNNSSLGVISFETVVNYPTGAATNVIISDIDGDGKSDIAVTNYENGFITFYRNVSIPGLISFGPKTEIAVGLDTYGITSADFDGDNKPDFAVLSSADNTISIFKNLSTPGTITFEPKIDFATPVQPYYITQGDIDGDERPDLAITSSYGIVAVYRNTSTAGSISFSPEIDVTSISFPTELALSDLDGDGKVDLAISAAGPNQVAMLKNNSFPGTINFQAKTDYVTGSTPFGIDATDLDNDGRSEIVTACSNSIAILKNQIGAPAISSFSPTNGAAGDTIAITGTNFTGTTSISFGGVPALLFIVVNDTTITGVIGNGASGNVSVTNTKGTDSLSGFTFIPVPTITSFTPTSAGTGTSVTITGTNLTGAIEVSFGGVAANSFIVNSATSITAVMAAGASGNVSVTTPIGTATLGGFTFNPVTGIVSPGNVNSTELKVYPNPSASDIVIKHPATIKMSKIIFIDASGKKVKTIYPGRNSNETYFNVNKLAQGIYTIIWSDGIRFLSRTIMVQ